MAEFVSLPPPCVLDLGDGLRALPSSREHAEEFLAMVARNRAHFGEFLPQVAAITTADAALRHFQAVEHLQAQQRLREWMLLADGRLCGQIRFNQIDPENRSAGVGYLLDAAAGGRGVMTRAMRGMLRHAFLECGFHRIELRCAITNEASRRLALRLGFRQEGVLREAEILQGRAVDLQVFGLLRREFPIAP